MSQQITNIKITTGWEKFKVSFDYDGTYDSAAISMTTVIGGNVHRYPSIPYTTGVMDLPDYSYRSYKLTIVLTTLHQDGVTRSVWSDEIQFPPVKNVKTQSYFASETGTDYVFIRYSPTDPIIPIIKATFSLATPSGYANPVPNKITVNYDNVIQGFLIEGLRENYPYTVWMDSLYAGGIPGFEAEGISERAVPRDAKNLNFSTRRLTTVSVRQTLLTSPVTMTISRGGVTQRNTTTLVVKSSSGSTILTKNFEHADSYINYSFTESEIDLILKNNTTRDRVNFTATVSTIEGGVVKGSKSASSQLVILSFDTMPIIQGASYKDINAKALSFTNNNQTIIQNQSQLQFNIASLKAQAHATIARLSVQIGGTTRSKTYSGVSEITNETFLFDKVNLETSNYALIQITDSRGFTESLQRMITIEPYSPPQHAVYSATRTNGFEDDSYLNYTTLITKIMENDFELRYRIKEDSAEEWDTEAVLAGFSQEEKDTHFEIKGNEFLGARSNEKKFIIELIAEDYFETTIQEIFLDKGKGLAIIDKDGWEWQERIKGVGANGSTSYMATIQDVIDLINQR